MAADTGLYLLFPALDELCYPRMVGEELPRHAHRVYLAFRYRLRRVLGAHPARADHGYVHEFPDMRHVVQIAVFGHICRRVRPIPGVISAVVRVEHVVARVLKIFRRALALFHVAPDFDIFFPGDGALAKALCLTDDRIAQRNGIILAAGFLDRLDNLDGETITVFETAAVFVRALVGVRESELIQEIALVHGVHLDAVHPRLLAKAGGLGKSIDELLYLLLGERAAGGVLRPARGKFARRGADMLYVNHGFEQRAQKLALEHGSERVGDGERTPETRGQLHEQLCARLMYLVHELLELFEFFPALIEPLAADRVPKGRDPGNDESHVVFGDLGKKICRFLVEMIGLHPAEQRRPAHGAHDYPVFDLHLSYLPRGEERGIFLVHDPSLSARSALRDFFLYHRPAEAFCQ